jgi:hypothetical protein
MAHSRNTVKAQVGEAEGKHGTSSFSRISLPPMPPTETIPEFGFAQVLAL